MTTDNLTIGHSASCEIIRANAPKAALVDALACKGKFNVEHWRNGEKIGEYEINNLSTNEGRAAMLSVFFHGLTPITTWYLGLIDSTGYGTGPAVTDTYAQMASGNSWRENTAYTDTNNSGNGGTRPVFQAGAATTGVNPAVVTNATTSVYTVTTGGTVKGLFVVGGGSASATKSDVAGGGVLWAAALFTAGDVTTVTGDVLKVTYSVSA